MCNNSIIDQLRSKAQQSTCKFRISAIGFDRKGDIIGRAKNSSRFLRHGGGMHAEMALMAQYGKRLHSILICRIGRSGELRPIVPCDKCKEVANSLGIRIKTIW